MLPVPAESLFLIFSCSSAGIKKEKKSVMVWVPLARRGSSSCSNFTLAVRVFGLRRLRISANFLKKLKVTGLVESLVSSRLTVLQTSLFFPCSSPGMARAANWVSKTIAPLGRIRSTCFSWPSSFLIITLELAEPAVVRLR